jgi:hypothetical protein
MDDVTREYVDAINRKVANTPPKQPPLLDEVVWLEMYKAFMNWHAITRHSGLKYAEAADAGLSEFKKRFRD